MQVPIPHQRRSGTFIRMADGQDEFYKNLGTITNIPGDADTLVKGLNKYKFNDNFFSTYIKKLPSVTLIYKGNPSYGIYPPLPGKSLTVKDPRMKGEFSNVFTNTEGPFVYKVLVP
jgi:hypothetical protein